MPGPNLGNLLASLNPTSSEIAQLFWALGKVPPNVLRAIIKSLDEEMLRKFAIWSQTFIQYINDLGPAAVDPESFRESLASSGMSGDFMHVMHNTRFTGPKLDLENVSRASNKITKAIKAQNWQDAVYVGLTLSKFVPW